MYSSSLFRFTPGQKNWIETPRAYPNSTLKKLVFPFDKIENSYDIDFYQPHMTNGILSKFEIDTFFKNLYSQVDYFCFPTTRYLRKLFPCSVQVPLSMLFFSLILHLCFDLGNTLSMLLFIFDGLLVLWATFGIMGVVRTFKRVEFDTRMRIGHFLDQQNIGYFSTKGMRWTLPLDHFNWIELHLDYKIKHETEAYFKILHEMVSSELGVLVFPLNEINHTFDHNFYMPTLTSNRLSKSETDIFINRIKQNTIDDLKKLKLKTKCLLILMIAVVVGLIGLSLKHSPNEVSNSSLYYIESFILALYFVTVWGIAIKGNQYFKKVHQDIRHKIGLEVESENVNLIHHGVRWYLPADDYRWLELWLDYKYINEEVVIPVEPVEEEDIHKYRFRDAESLPLYQWGRHFNFDFKPLESKEMDYINFSTHEDREKLAFRME